MLEVLHPGLLTTLQDGGRAGYAHLGIGRAGAADVAALRLANALVGNAASACGIEMTLRGPRLRLDRDARVALVGAPLPQARCNGAPWPMWASLAVAAGSELDCGAMPHGCRSWLAISGGVEVVPWLGSRACDVNAGLGPPPLHAGDRLPLGASTSAVQIVVDWSLDPRPWLDAADMPLRIVPSRHTALLDAASRTALSLATFAVATDSNRVGTRLTGPRLTLTGAPDIVSEGTVAGTVQLPPNGQAIVLGCEHPVSGGYPRIAQLAAVDLPRLAQRRPGDSVSLQWITPGQAQAALHERERALATLEQHIHDRLIQSSA